MKRTLTFLPIIIFSLAIVSAGTAPGIMTATANTTAVPSYLLQWRGGFNAPHGIAVDSSGNVYVTDTMNYKVKKYNSSGNFILEFGSQGSGNSQFDTVTGVVVHSQGIAIDSSNNVYVVDPGNNRVQKFDSSGNYLSQFGLSGSNEGEFNQPYEIVIDASNNIYVSNANVFVQKYSPSGIYISRFGGWGSQNGQFQAIRGMAVDSSGNIYVVDSGDSSRTRIQKFDSSGNYISKFGSWGTGDGQFKHPQGISLDNCGNIYVIDKGSHRVQKFDSSGNYMLQWGSYGHSREPNTFWYPRGIAVDASNNAYVLDRDNGNVQKFYLSDCTEAVTIPDKEREALIAFYNSTQGNLWSNVRGWLGSPGTECSWQGITCDSDQSHVTGINLSYHSFRDGVLPPEMGDLTYLNTLYLRNFYLIGNFPFEFANLANLNVLDVKENKLTGEIPAELKNFFMKTWASLGLSGNDLCTDDPQLRNHIYSFEGHHITLPACTACTEDAWECGSWSECSSSGIQTRNCEIVAECLTADTPSPETTRSCTPSNEFNPAPTCTADTWVCGNWGVCSDAGIKTRTCEMTVNCPSVVTPSPSTSMSCTSQNDESEEENVGNDDCAEDTWVCGEWGECSEGGQRTRSCLKTYECPIVESAPPLTIDSCTPGASDDSGSGQNITIINIIIDKIKIDIQQIIEEAGLIVNNVFIGKERNENKEGEISLKYTEKITDGSEISIKVKNIITNFITYGTPTTISLGEGERAGVVNSYRGAFGKLPEHEDDWEDVVKIANGRWPGKNNTEREEKMKKDFKRIYLREPNKEDPHDDAALTVMTYGLRPADRNLNSERAAIKIFRDIYGNNPASAVDWDIVRSIAYSGAKR